MAKRTQFDIVYDAAMNVKTSAGAFTIWTVAAEVDRIGELKTKQSTERVVRFYWKRLIAKIEGHEPEPKRSRRQSERDEITKLQLELAESRKENAKLEVALAMAKSVQRQAGGNMDNRTIKILIGLIHPDRHSEASAERLNKATSILNKLK